MENLKIFYTKVMENPELKAKFEKILDVSENEEITAEQIQQIIELAKEVDVEISAEDIENYLDSQENESEKMNDGELEMVAGGKGNDLEKTPHSHPPVFRLHCFTGDSKISTPSGAKVIGEIKVGDEVFSLDAQNKKIVAKVIEVCPVADEEIFKVEFANGAIWYTTETQWFYCGNDDYACAIDSKGKAALAENGEKAAVVKVTKTGEVKKVYDFITDGLNIFFVEGIAAEGYSVD